MKNLHFIVSSIVFFVMFIFCLAAAGDVGTALFMALFFGGSSLMALWIIKVNAFNAYKTNTASLERVTESLNQANAALRGRDLDIIPSAYRDRASMTFIYDALMNQRAMNVQEAINLYEDQKYKNQMADIEARKVQELQRLNRSVQANTRKRRR